MRFPDKPTPTAAELSRSRACHRGEHLLCVMPGCECQCHRPPLPREPERDAIYWRRSLEFYWRDNAYAHAANLAAPR